MVNGPILGLDIDKESFEACLLNLDKTHRRKFKNSKSGFSELDEWLKKLACVQVFACMEATGRYGEELAEHLYSAGHSVVIANPAFIASHKKTINQQNKTDPKDAEVIADYVRCFQERLRTWTPMDPTRKKLLDVIGQLALLKKTQTAFTNRAKCGLSDETTIASLGQLQAQIKDAIEALERRRDELFEMLPALQEVRIILDEVPGIGLEISSALAAKIDFANFPSGRELACFLGLSSSEWKSGKQKKRGRQRKAGEKSLRALVRQGAAAAMRTRFFSVFIARLRRKGLTTKQIVSALARKILLIAHALVRNKQSFDRFYKHPLALH